MKSATYAGFIDQTTGRFVKPGIPQREEGKQQQNKIEKSGGGSGGEPPEIDPIIQGLLARLPKSGDVWPESERKLWLDLLAGSFKLIYKESASTSKSCPECGYQFHGSGWEGIDAHWKANHEQIMPYEKALPLIKAGTYRKQ